MSLNNKMATWTKVKNLSPYSLHAILTASWLFRVALIIYGTFHDRYMTLQYTDIDYHVFSNASLHVLQGHSPYLELTYRYTPLIAWILIPNHVLFYSFGKCVFITLDIYAAYLIYKILSLQKRISELNKLISCLFWLFNPVTAIVSSRGNAESLMAVLMLQCVYYVMNGSILKSALLYGVAVHVKVYPIIHCLGLVLSVDDRTPWERVECCNENYHNTKAQRRKGIKINNNNISLQTLYERVLACTQVRIKWSLLFTIKRLQFALVSALSFISLTVICYCIYGWDFIYQTYLYHVTRTDISHNFSIYFYMLYITKDTWLAPVISKMAFLPQLAITLFSTVLLHRDVPMCVFVQTFLFVTFNKVVTSQYFLWYLCYLPLIIPHSSLTLKQATVMATLWLTAQGVWLFPAYLLEYQGMDTYLFIWMGSCVFFITNVCIIVIIISGHSSLHVTTTDSVASIEIKKKNE